MAAAVAGDLLCQPVRRVVLCGAYERAVARGLRDGDVILPSGAGFEPETFFAWACGTV